MYKLIKAVPLLVHDSENIFMMLEISRRNYMIAIDKESHHYLLLNDNDLTNCVQERM